MDRFETLVKQRQDSDVFSSQYRPLFYRLSSTEEEKKLLNLLEDTQVKSYDKIEKQLEDLVLIQNPSKSFSAEELKIAIQQKLGGQSLTQYGVWVYYPWSKRLVHLLDEEEFIEVRTNRNMYKITPKERTTLRQKCVGIAGLSVGQTAAINLAMERLCGKLRLADFDTMDLSNINRIRAGVQELSVPKVVYAARQIAEIDPFLEVACYGEGLTESNMDAFFTQGGKIDLLIEECDNVQIKLLARIKAKELKVPVLMDTSDRGILDIERFDLEPERPIFHGKLPEGPETSLTNFLEDFYGWENLSVRLRGSLIEQNTSLRGITQLASDVSLGGAISAHLVRRIFLNQFEDSGRYAVDLDRIFPGKDDAMDASDTVHFKDVPELELSGMRQLSHPFLREEGQDDIGPEKLTRLVEAANLAASAANLQPWKWLYRSKSLFLFLDLCRSNGLLDFKQRGGYISLGNALENLVLKSHQEGLELKIECFVEDEAKSPLVAKINFFSKSEKGVEPHYFDELALGIESRFTNRCIEAKQDIPLGDLKKLSEVVDPGSGAELEWIHSNEQLQSLGQLLGMSDRIRWTDPTAHFDIVHELRWTPEETASTRDGVDIATLMAPPPVLSVLNILKDYRIVSFLRKNDLGHGLGFMSQVGTQNSAAVGILTMPDFSALSHIRVGRVIERLWLAANQLGLSIQPMAPILYFFSRLNHGQGVDFSEYSKGEVAKLQVAFDKAFPKKENRERVFMFRLFKSSQNPVRSLRRPIDHVLFIE